jgi:alanine-synthesizing transaminase
MRRKIVHAGASQLKYEIRNIPLFARQLEPWGIEVTWENIGDPINKGECLPDWIKEKVVEAAREDSSYAYTDTQGLGEARAFLAQRATERGGARVRSEDIIFFNGLGDAVAKVFGFLRREARVLGPSPAYSTFSSAEAAHSGYEHLTYRLDPDRQWMPDFDDIEKKVRYNDSIAGLLLINPDNPTGTVYPKETLKEFVRIARKYDVFLVCDETYINIVYGGAKTAPLSEVIGEVPGMALRSVSKELPWPGARCGWAEVYNQDRDPEFAAYARSLLDAKRLEVCSTSLPQIVIPRVMSDPRYPAHLERRAAMFGARAAQAARAFSGIPGLRCVEPRGALYLTCVFDRERAELGSLRIEDEGLQAFIAGKTEGAAADKRFAYQLLAKTGICVVPLSGFACDLPGFRMTLLETDEAKREWVLKKVAAAAREFLGD